MNLPPDHKEPEGSQESESGDSVSKEPLHEEPTYDDKGSHGGDYGKSAPEIPGSPAEVPETFGAPKASYDSSHNPPESSGLQYWDEYSDQDSTFGDSDYNVALEQSFWNSDESASGYENSDFWQPRSPVDAKKDPPTGYSGSDPLTPKALRGQGTTPPFPPSAKSGFFGSGKDDRKKLGGKKSNDHSISTLLEGKVNTILLSFALLAMFFSVTSLILTYTRDDVENVTTIIRESNLSSTSPTPAVRSNIDIFDGIEIIDNEVTATEVAAARVLQSSVTVETESSMGSGFFYDDSGLILTAAHVVVGPNGNLADSVVVGITDGDRITYRVEGRVLGADQKKDVAVIKIDTDVNFVSAALALDKSIRIGQDVIAVGNPFSLENTVTAGIVSAVNRTVTSDSGEVLGFNLIQTDAPINSGNSGGALANLNGEIVGINILIQTGNSGASGNVGVGFSVPIAQAKEVADDIVRGEVHDELGYLGIQGRSSSIGKAGALVVDVVEGEPAAIAGIMVDDLIIGADGRNINSFTDLLTVIQLHEPNDEVEIDILRYSINPATGEQVEERITVNLVLGSVVDANNEAEDLEN